MHAASSQAASPLWARPHAPATAGPGRPVPAEEVLGVLRWNLAALRGRAPEGLALAEAAAELFRERVRRGEIRAVAAADGGVDWSDDRGVMGMGEARAHARGATLDFLTAGASQPAAAERAPKPIVIDGLNPPTLLRRIFDGTPTLPDGYAPRLLVAVRDAGELARALASEPLGDVLASERVELFIGPDAPARLSAWLDGRAGCAMPEQLVQTPGAEGLFGRTLVLAVEAARERQVALAERLTREVNAVYGPRDRAWWAGRFERALGGGGEPLRVLLPISRFSTYVRHAVADLAEALSAQGCETRVLSEPDDHSKLATPAYLWAFAEFQPDLVVMTNFTRAQLGGAAPANVPLVCWIQDAMQHLFGDQAGRSQTDLDFLAGYIIWDLTNRLGYPRERALPFPIVASSRKFRPEAAPAEARRRAECEIGYISHHSEPPEPMLERLRQAAGANPAFLKAFEGLLPVIERITDDPMAERPLAAISAAVDAAVDAVAGPGSAQPVRSTLRHQFAVPYAERLLRHKTLRWAAAIARRRGWRMKLFGRGWDRHPEFAPFAAGPLGHGEELRAACQASAVQLHVSVNGLVHQRVIECAMSGGLPACRLHAEELYLAELWAAHNVTRSDTVEDRVTLPHYGRVFRWCDHPELWRLGMLRQRLGLALDEAGFEATGWHRHAVGSGLLVARPQAAEWLLQDLAETTFRSPEELESLVERATGDAEWRAGYARAIGDRCRRYLTHDALADAMLNMLRTRLSA
ncbi:MAG: hypothetical protein IBJ11_03430 [Phycisphaerales bacterium]|nr:hypothetical protein [Phycisphaerales bacterium]